MRLHFDFRVEVDLFKLEKDFILDIDDRIVAAFEKKFINNAVLEKCFDRPLKILNAVVYLLIHRVSILLRTASSCLSRRKTESGENTRFEVFKYGSQVGRKIIGADCFERRSFIGDNDTIIGKFFNFFSGIRNFLIRSHKSSFGEADLHLHKRGGESIDELKSIAFNFTKHLNIFKSGRNSRRTEESAAFLIEIKVYDIFRLILFRRITDLLLIVFNSSRLVYFDLHRRRIDAEIAADGKGVEDALCLDASELRSIDTALNKKGI